MRTVTFSRPRRRPSLGVVVAFVFLLLLTALWVYPFVWMFAASFKTNQAILSDGLKLMPSQPTFAAYGRAWNEAHFNTYFMNSVITTGATILIVVFRYATSGYVLAMYDFPGKSCWRPRC